MICKFFEEISGSGYVLNFSSENFKIFIKKIIPDFKWWGSKGKTLRYYIMNSETNQVIRLTNELIRYFDSIYDEKDKALSSPNQEKRYRDIKKFINNNKAPTTLILNKSKILDSNYIQDLIKNMIINSKKFPAATIGLSKDLLEAVIKTLLEKQQIEYSRRDSLETKANKLLTSLGLTRKTLKTEDDNIEEISTIIVTDFNQIIKNLNNLRNIYGTGHGKGELQKGRITIPTRYAELAIGSTSTVINFLIQTYDYKIGKTITIK